MNSFSGLSLDDRKLIVGVDFGTTFSGVAWAETKRVSSLIPIWQEEILILVQSDHQSLIESWPASLGTREGVSSVKVPTEIRYTAQGIEWGFQIPPIIDRHRWFKVLVNMRLLQKKALRADNTAFSGLA